MNPAIARTSTPRAQYRTRLTVAVTLSLLAHALILSLQFGIPGLGLPGLELPWRERRAQSTDLDVLLAGAKPAPAISAESSPDPTPTSALSVQHPDPSTSMHPGAHLRLLPQRAPASVPPVAKIPKNKHKKTKRKTETRTSIARRKSVPVKRPAPVIALSESREENFVLPAPAREEEQQEKMPPAETADQPIASTEPATPQLEDDTAARKLAEEEAARRIAEQEANAKREAMEQQARRQAEEARQAAQQREEEETRQRASELATRQQEEARRQEQANAERAERHARELAAQRQAEEAAHLQASALALQQQLLAEKERQEGEAARRTLELEAQQRKEAKNLEQAKAEREAMELEARRQAEEAARRQAAAAERQRQAEERAAKERAQELATRQQAETARTQRRDPEPVLGDSPPSGSARAWNDNRPPDVASLPRNLTGGGLAARALEQARQPDTSRSAPQAIRPDNGTEPARRRSIFGSTDQDVGLAMYIESWRLKIEGNGSLNYPKASVEKAHGDPVVTIAVRSDGSVEDIFINRSSGRPELDEAIRRIARLYAKYSAFPPELARRYDVIEIRRVWNFEGGLRILEEVR